MRKLSLLLLFVFLLSACGGESPNKDAFIDPIITDEELMLLYEAPPEPGEGLVFTEVYTFEHVNLPKMELSPVSLCWWDGLLLIVADRGFAVLNEDGTMKPLAFPGIRIPFAMAPGSDGNLYIVHDVGHYKDSVLLSLSVFNKEHEIVSTASSSIPCDPEYSRLNTNIAVFNGSVYLTFSESTRDVSGLIYKMSSEGSVSNIGGNKSIGHFASIPNGVVFVNGGFPAKNFEVSNDLVSMDPSRGISRIYKIIDDIVTDHVALPVGIRVKHSEDTLDAWVREYEDLTGTPLSDDLVTTLENGNLTNGINGYGGVCVSGNSIIVASNRDPFLSFYDLDLNYQYTQAIDFSGFNHWDPLWNFREENEGKIKRPFYQRSLCTNPENGTLYILCTYMGKSGLLIGTPIADKAQ